MFINYRTCNNIHPNYLPCCWIYQESIKRRRENQEIDPPKNKKIKI